jgi:hypothetical protein
MAKAKEPHEAFFHLTAVSREAHHFSLFFLLGAGFGGTLTVLGVRNRAAIERSMLSRTALPNWYVHFMGQF